MGRMIIRVLLAVLFWFIGFFILLALVFGTAGLSAGLLFLWIPTGVASCIGIVNKIIPPNKYELTIKANNIEKTKQFDWKNFILFILGFIFPAIWLIMFIEWIIKRIKEV